MDYETHIPNVVYDSQQREYYNKRSDLFLGAEEIDELGLRPYDQIENEHSLYTVEYFDIRKEL